jgi:hypothetical protein
MKLISKQDAAKRIQNASSVGELDLKSAADVPKLLNDLKQQTPCIVLVCVK